MGLFRLLLRHFGLRSFSGLRSASVMLPSYSVMLSAYLLRGVAQSTATAAPRSAVDWAAVMGQALVIATVVWIFSYLRFRRVLREKRVLEKNYTSCAAELEAEKSILSTLRKLPSRDRITMAWNRTAIMEILVREMLRAVRESSSLGIVIAELDDLKTLQTDRGVDASESVIQQTAERLLSVMRAYDAVGHYRDHDFLIVLPGWNPESAPQRIVSILDTIGLKPCIVGEAPLRVTSSLGVAAFDPRMDSPYPEELLRRADDALHMSKAAGPNHAVVAPR